MLSHSVRQLNGGGCTSLVPRRRVHIEVDADAVLVLEAAALFALHGLILAYAVGEGDFFSPSNLLG
jgi:hypothetical protein